MTLHHLKRGMEYGVIDGGRSLADTAAHLIHRRAAGVDRRSQIALGRRSAAGGIVIGENFSGHQNYIVAGLRGQLHIVLPVRAAAHPGDRLAQQVGKQLLVKTFGGLLREDALDGNREGLALCGGLIGRLKGGSFKLHALHMGNDLKGLGVHLRILGRDAQLLTQRLKIRLHRGIVRQSQLQLAVMYPAPEGFNEGVLLQLLINCLFYGLPVDGQSGCSLGHDQLVALYRVLILAGLTANDRFGLVEQVFHHLLVHAVIAQFHVHIIFRGVGAQQMIDILSALGKEVSSAHPPGIQRRILTKGLQLVGGDGTAPISVVQGDGCLVAVLFHRLLHQKLSLLDRHTSNIQLTQLDIGHNGPAGTHPDAQSQITGQHHTGGNTCPDCDASSVVLFLAFDFSCSSHAVPSLRPLPDSHTQWFFIDFVNH